MADSVKVLAKSINVMVLEKTQEGFGLQKCGPLFLNPSGQQPGLEKSKGESWNVGCTGCTS